MKRFLLIFTFAFSAVAASADVATSADYEITYVSLDGGGHRSSSEAYTNDTVIGTIAGGAAATIAVANVAGYAGQLNNPPIAFDDLKSHPFNEPLDIPSAFMLQNDFDLDQDVIRIGIVDGRTEAGGLVLNTRGIFQYVPPAGFNGTDRFNYVIFDENGDLDSAVVNLVVAPVASQKTNSVALYRLSDGNLLLRAQLRAGLSEYYIESTDRLEDVDSFGRPIWKEQLVFKAGVDGLVEMIIDPADEQRRFYRAWAL